MKNAKKVLSVVLSIILAISSCSVCFSTIASAANDTNAVKNFKTAVKCEAMKNFTASSSKSETGSGDSKVITNTFTYTAPSWEYYQQIVNVLTTFDTAMKGLDEYKNNEGHNKNGDCSSSRTKCTDFAKVRTALESVIGSDLETLEQTYHLDDFLDCVLSMKNAVKHQTTTGNSKSDVASRIDNVFEARSSSLAYITQFSDVDDIEEETVNTRYKYTLFMCRQNYSSGWGFWKTNYYHHAINTNNSNAKNEAPSASKTANTKKDKLQEAKALYVKNDAYFKSNSVKEVLAVSTDAEVLAVAAQEIQDAYALIDEAYGTNAQKVHDHFFSSYDVDATVKLINNAVVLLEFKPIADDLKSLCATDYSSYTKEEILVLLNTIEEKYTVYQNADAATKALIVETYDLDTAKAESTIEALDKAYQIKCIEEAKVTADSHKNTYSKYDIDGVDDGTVTSSMLTEAVALIGNDITVLEKYNKDYVAEVCGESYLSDLKTLKTDLTNLGKAAGYNEKFLKEYKKFASEIENASKADSETLTETLKNYDKWYSDLKKLIDEMKTELGEETAEKLFDELDVLMTEHMDAAYIALNARLEAQIDSAYTIYNAYVETYGEKVMMSSKTAYKQLEASIGLIDTDIYNFLNGKSDNFTVSAETVEKYKKLQNALTYYETFEANRGFDTYTQTKIDDIVRQETVDDIAREGDYTVTDENVEKIIKLIDTALGDENVKNLLGFDLGELLDGAIDSIYSDAVINAIIQYVYPGVANEFVKAWADLPSSITIEDVDTGIMGITADVDCGLTIDSVEKAIGNVGVNCFPSTLGALIEKDYPQFTQAAKQLQQATTPAVKDTSDPWKDAVLYNDEGTTFNLVWGVTDRESFIDAAVAALSGLEPLLLSIISNQNFKQAHKIGTGSGNAKVFGIPLSLSVDPIELVLMASANDGYDNALAPIFEALGCTDIPHGEDLTSTRKVLEDGLFALLDQILNKFKANPVETVLEILPNLVYALEADLVTPLLSMLKTNITYTANASYKVLGGTISGSMSDVYNNYDKPEKVNIADMVDLKSMGVDLSSFDALWNMIMGLLHVSIPAPDSSVLATMGELTWKDTNRSEKTYSYGGNKAAYIEANKADILIYLVKYVLDNDIIGMFFDLETADAVIKEIIENISSNSDLTIAAVVELLNQIGYPLKDYEWYDGSVGGTVEGLTPAMEIYLSSDNNWNPEVAKYITENINEIVDSVLSLAGLNVDLSAELENLIYPLFTNANITAVVKMLGSLDLSSMPDLEKLLKDELNLDLSAFANYKNLSDDTNWGFTDGDAKGFADAIAEILEPFVPVLGFILSGENLTVFEGTDGETTLIGYDGYDSAIIPLLEAFGLEVQASEELDASGALKETLYALIDLLDKVIDDPINEIIDLLPSVIYFIASNGVSTAVMNLLQPVYVILDTIRPIYDFDLDVLLASLINGEKNEGDSGYISLKLDELNVGFIVSLIESFTGLDLEQLQVLLFDVSKVIGAEYTSASTLFTSEKKAKRGAYSDTFSQSDMLTVILSFALEYLSDKDNAEQLDKLLGTNGLISSLDAVFKGTQAKYSQYDWMYYFGEDNDFTEDMFKLGISVAPTLVSLEYPNNWTQDTAKYIYDNLSDIIDDVLALMGMGTLEELMSDVSIYSSENVEVVINLITGLLESVDDTLLETLDVVLDLDLTALKNCKVPEGIDTAEEFASALAGALGCIDGLVKWLFFGEDYAFFLTSDGKDAVTIYGADGYAQGLAYILEALGCENLPTEYSDTAVYEILLSAFKLVDKVLTDPVNTVFEILPNLIYFINADGLTAGVNNTLSAVYALLETLENLGLEVDLNALLADLTKDYGFTVSLDDLSLDAIIDIAEALLKIDLSLVSETLSDFCVGKIKAYNAVGGDGYKMYYNTDFARYDMLTIIVTLLLQVVELEENEEPMKDLVGEDVYDVILNFYDMIPVEMQDMSYILTEYEGQTLSAIELSELYKGWGYGPLYTEEMAQYIADNFGDFIDNIIYLLGIEVNGIKVDDLKEVIYAFLDGSVYTEKTAQSVLDLLKSLPEALKDLTGDAGVHINAVIKTALGVDLNYWDNYEIGEVNDRASFTKELCNMLEPFYPVLKWLLANEDFAFFVDNDASDIITVLGADGYAYGVVPILETLGCDGVLTTEEYYKAVENDDSVLITSIINPLLDKIDSILNAESPAEEILKILPSVIYFINSNGLDTCFKNILNAVYTLLNAIEPIVVVDIYELIGLDLSEFESLFDMLIDLIRTSTGYDLSEIKADFIAELTMGTVVSYTSANGKKAYTMVYAEGESGSVADMVTVILRLALTFIGNDKNVEALSGILSDAFNMDEKAKEYVDAVLNAIVAYQLNTHMGMDQALAMIFYLFRGTDIGVDNTAGSIKDVNAQWIALLEKLGKSDDPNEATVGNLIAKIVDLDIFKDVIDSETGIAPNGFIAFFQKIIEWFKSIFQWIKNLFS